MFIPRSHGTRRGCDHCAECKWCHQRNLLKECFTLKEGPARHVFCDTQCSANWVTYRHRIGVAHVIKMDRVERDAHLNGHTIDEFISNGMITPCEVKQS